MATRPQTRAKVGQRTARPAFLSGGLSAFAGGGDIPRGGGLVQATLDRGPERAHFVGGDARGRKLGDAEAVARGFLEIDSRGDERRQQSAHRLQRLGAELDARALLGRRALVEEERIFPAERLHRLARRLARPQVEGVRTGRHDGEIGDLGGGGENALVGILVGFYYNRIMPNMGVMYGLKAFVAAVVGGIGVIPGAMMGGMLMGLSEVFVIGFVSSMLKDAIAFIILIFILLVKPAGLFGKAGREKV